MNNSFYIPLRKGYTNMEIRKTMLEDVDSLLMIFERARGFMRSIGNYVQWINGYPSREQVVRDIEAGCSYCVLNVENKIVGTFVAVEGEDPTYREIWDGAWLNDEPYVTIHRLASDGSEKGMAEACLQWCMARWDNIRADTHRDNQVLLHILPKYGFRRCGIIHVADGSERIAFQWLR